MPLVRRALAQSPARRLAGRLVIATAGEHLLSTGLVGQYGTVAFGLYPLRQHAGQEESLRGLARLAGAGDPVLIFPQGVHAAPEAERAGDPAARFKPGVAHLAAALDAAVVPFGLAGTEAVIPPAAPPDFKGYVIAGIPVLLRRGPLAIAFGPPLTREPNESPQAFTARLQEVCYALTRQAEGALQPQGAGGINRVPRAASPEP
jgi:1-acyl-sn-glycerol-3-phosphate acyltransferase